MALAVNFTRRFDIEAGRILRCGDIAGTVQSTVKVVAELVHTGNDEHTLLAEGKCRKAVAFAVDVYNLARLGDGVCA